MNHVSLQQIKKAIDDHSIEQAKLSTLLEFRAYLANPCPDLSAKPLWDNCRSIVADQIRQRETARLEAERAQREHGRHADILAQAEAAIAEATRLNARAAMIDSRLASVEKAAGRSPWGDPGIWIAMAAVVIAGCAWLFPKSPQTPTTADSRSADSNVVNTASSVLTNPPTVRPVVKPSDISSNQPP